MVHQAQNVASWGAPRLPLSVQGQMNQYYAAPLVQGPQEQPLILSQTSASTENVDAKKDTGGLSPSPDKKIQTYYGKRREQLDTGVTSMKQMNTHATLLLYFCIMTVLVCCCLGRCLIVPLSQASNYELNSRKHFSKLDKTGFI